MSNLKDYGSIFAEALDLRLEEKTAVIINGMDLFTSTKQMDLEMDFSKLLSYFKEYTRFLRATYYTMMLDMEDRVLNRPLVDYLNLNGYSVRSKSLRESRENAASKRFRPDLDVEICVDALTMAPGVDHIVFFAGNNDLAYLIQRLKDMNVRVTVVSNRDSSGLLLRRECDHFVDLGDIIDTCHKQKAHEFEVSE